MLGLIGHNRPPAAAGGEAFRFLQIRMTGFNNPSFLLLTELEWSNDGGTTKYPYAVNNAFMTSPTAPSPLVASAPATNAGTLHAPYNGNTNIDADYWQHSNGGAETFHRIDLGAGNEISPNQCVVRWYRGGGAFYATDYTLEGSNTGSFTGEETVLHTVTGNSAYEITYDF